MTNKIEKVEAYRYQDTLDSTVEDHIEDAREEVFRKYLYTPRTGDHVSYWRMNQHVPEKHLPFFGKEEAREFFKDQMYKNYKEGYKFGEDQGYDEMWRIVLDRLIKFHDDITRELKKIDENVKAIS